MTDATRNIEAALKLPITARAEVAAALLASMEGEDDADVDSAWDAEIQRRARRVLAGERGTPWLAVETEARARLK